MTSEVFGGLAILTYLASTVLMFAALRTEFGAEPEVAGQRWRPLVLAWAAAGFHAVATIDRFAAQGGIDFSFVSALATVAWVIVAIVLLASLIRPVEKLGLIVFPLAALFLLIRLKVPEGPRVVHNHSWPMRLHILSSMLAFAFLCIGAIQALLLALQDWRLRRHHPGGWLVRSLPPLETMENLLFQLIGAGFALLSLSLVTGFAFLEDMFAQHLVHKTVLSILAWIVFAVLLAGRMHSGWRGQVAIRWTLGGFVSLLLAYFGSKMVLELILNRA